jgi:hypothetical protein
MLVQARSTSCDMLEDHARDHQVIAAARDVRLGEIAGDVESRRLQPGRRQRQFARVDIVDDQVDAVARGLLRENRGSRPPPISQTRRRPN